MIPESLSEERCNKVLQRVELMNRVRSALRSDHFDERIQLCRRSADLPPWWRPGEHDRHLLIGVSKSAPFFAFLFCLRLFDDVSPVLDATSACCFRHGFNKSEEFVVHDNELCFKDVWLEMQREVASAIAAPHETRAITRSATKSKDDEETAKTSPTKTEAGEGDAAGERESESQEDEREAKEEPRQTEEAKCSDAAKSCATVVATVADVDTEETTAEAATAEPSVDATINQILSQQSGTLLQWPKVSSCSSCLAATTLPKNLH